MASCPSYSWRCEKDWGYGSVLKPDRLMITGGKTNHARRVFPQSAPEFPFRHAPGWLNILIIGTVPGGYSNEDLPHRRGGRAPWWKFVNRSCRYKDDGGQTRIGTRGQGGVS